MSFNLKNEVSLYLQEYNNTSIEWYPWTKEPFRRAKEEKKAIFLSIGYSGCALCKRVKEESFQDKLIIELLNSNFISIKVDKDERRDIDKYYKQIYKLMNSQECSSPLFIFMSENLEPFYSVAYIPPKSKDGILGLKELLETIIEKYSNDKATLIEKGQEILSFINPNKARTIQATKLHIGILNIIKRHIDEVYDSDNGGFGTFPKFLNSSILELLLEVYSINGELLDKVLYTLREMADREIFDSKRGGFYTYSNDKNWSRPRREKMLYDNANISAIYIEAFKITKDDFYKNIALKNIDFILEFMSKDNLFYSNLLENSDNSLFIDTKIVTSFNAMVIDTLFGASTIDKKYLNIAIDSLERLLDRYYIDGELYHTDNIKAFLEDYAYLGVALLSGYRVTQNEEYLIIAQTLINKSIERFYEYGRWKFSQSDIVVYDDIYDLTYPSATATMIYLIESINPLIEGEYGDFIFKSLEINSYNLMRQPLSYPKMTKALLVYLKQ